MSAKEACPEKAQLQRMLDGTLPPDDQTQVSVHLEGCPECQTQFEDLANKTKLLPDWEVQAGEHAESALQRVMEKIAGEGPDAATRAELSDHDELYLPFLSPSDNPEHLGRLGPYDVVGLIGQGGMGVVLKAHDPRLNRFVAIKVLAPQLAAGAAARKRFLREARAAAAVSHDHIVTIHAVDEVNGFPYLVMEYVVGLSLAERIARTGPLGLKETLRIGMQIASGLAAAHAHGLVHRDIKPANILLENSVERVKITDFGLARAAGDVQVTQTGQVAGTPEYMSPEQARGQSLDHRSDLFSLGCVMYAMCSGRSPFRAESFLDAIMRVCNDPPRPLREIDPETPDWLVEIIDKLLAKDPNDRFQSAGEVADLLGQHLAYLQQPTVVGPPPRMAATKPDAATGPGKRSPSRLWIVAAAALVLLGVLGMTEATGVTQLAATVIRIIRPEGTLEIVVDDPAVKVKIDGEEITIDGAGPQEVRLRLGQHQIEAAKDGKPVHQELVTITRGGKQVVTVHLEGSVPKGLLAPAEPKAAAATTLPAPPAGPVREIAKEVRTFSGHTSIVNGVAFSPDGRLIASGGGCDGLDCTIRLWDVADGREIRRWVAHGISVNSVTFSPDGRRLLSGGQDKLMRLWNVETGKEIRKFECQNGKVFSVAFSPDGRRAISGSADWHTGDNAIRLWDVETGAELKRFEGHLNAVLAVAFSPDGKRVLSGGQDTTVILWDAASAKALRQLQGHRTEIHCVAISPDGRLAISGGWADRLTAEAQTHLSDPENCVVCVWDLQHGQLLRRLTGHEGAIHSVAFSPDGRYALSGSGGQVVVSPTLRFCHSRDNTVRLWDVESGRELCRFAGPRDAVYGVAFSPDGRFVLACGNDYTIRLWELPEDLLPPAEATAAKAEAETPAARVEAPRKIKSFDAAAKPITQDGVTVEQNAWRIEAKEKRTVRLFEVPDPGMEDCTLTYRAKLKSANLDGQAYLEMWCRMPGGGEFFSKGIASPVKGTTDWASYETPFFLKKGERPDMIKLNVVMEGKGTLWIKDVELLQGPLPGR